MQLSSVHRYAAVTSRYFVHLSVPVCIVIVFVLTVVGRTKFRPETIPPRFFSFTFAPRF